jgi:transposase
MPAKNFLNSETKEKLQKALKEHEHPDIRERVLMLLLLNDGNTQKYIAELIGCSLSKVAYWCVHGDPDNLDSRSDERRKGNYRKVTEEYIKFLLEVIEIAPEKYGYEFGRWTTARLATYLEEPEYDLAKAVMAGTTSTPVLLDAAVILQGYFPIFDNFLTFTFWTLHFPQPTLPLHYIHLSLPDQCPLMLDRARYRCDY